MQHTDQLHKKLGFQASTCYCQLNYLNLINTTSNFTSTIAPKFRRFEQAIKIIPYDLTLQSNIKYKVKDGQILWPSQKCPHKNPFQHTVLSDSIAHKDSSNKLPTYQVKTHMSRLGQNKSFQALWCAAVGRAVVN